MSDAIDLTLFHDSVVAEIITAFPEFHVQFYRGGQRGDKGVLPVPCILLDCDSFEVDDDGDTGTGQSPTVWNFEARIIIQKINNGRASHAVRATAAKLVHFLKLRRFKDANGVGIPTGPARVTDSSRDDFDASMDHLEVWRVEWRQEINIGDNVWIDPDALRPTTVFVGIAPDIGTGNEHQYTTLPPDAEIKADE